MRAAARRTPPGFLWKPPPLDSPPPPLLSSSNRRGGRAIRSLPPPPPAPRHIPPPLQRLPCPVQLGRQRLLVRQLHPVLGGHHLVRQPVQRVPGHGGVLLRTQDQPGRRVLPVVRSMRLRVIQVQVHLPRVRVGEFPGLQVNHDQAPQPPAEELQVHPVPRIPHPQAALPPDERDIPAQLDQERLQVPDQRPFQLALGILVLQP